MTEIDTRTAGSWTDGPSGTPWPDARDTDRAVEAANHVVEAIFDILAEARDRAHHGGQ